MSFRFMICQRWRYTRTMLLQKNLGSKRTSPTASRCTSITRARCRLVQTQCAADAFTQVFLFTGFRNLLGSQTRAVT